MRNKLKQAMTQFQYVEGSGLTTTIQFNNWFNEISREHKYFRVLSFSVIVGRNLSNKNVETLYILFEYE